MKMIHTAVAAGALILAAGAAWSAPVTVKLTSVSPGGGTNVKITATPTGSTGNYRSVAQNYQQNPADGVLGAFVAWCLDLAATVSVGGTYKYYMTDDPFSNSFGLSDVQRGRVQAMFDANFASVSANLASNAAAFQLGLWEAAFESDGNVLNLGAGAFKGQGAPDAGITTAAAGYLTAAMDYLSGGGVAKYNLTFLESADNPRRQNLVTAEAVPLPAAAWLLLGGVGALVAMRRRGAVPPDRRQGNAAASARRSLLTPVRMEEAAILMAALLR